MEVEDSTCYSLEDRISNTLFIYLDKEKFKQRSGISNPIFGLEIALHIDVHQLEVFENFELIINQL